MITDEDKPVMALGTAFAASTIVFTIFYAIGKTLLRDAPVAFIIAVAFSLVALRVVYTRCLRASSSP
jgi:hypothetical protein